MYKTGKQNTINLQAKYFTTCTLIFHIPIVKNGIGKENNYKSKANQTFQMSHYTTDTMGSNFRAGYNNISKSLRPV